MGSPQQAAVEETPQAKLEEKNLKNQEVHKEPEKNVSHKFSISAFKSAVGREESDTVENLKESTKEELCPDKGKSFGNVLTMSGFKSLLSKGGSEAKPIEDTCNTAENNEKEADKEQTEEKPHGAALSIAGLKSFLTKGGSELKPVEDANAAESVDKDAVKEPAEEKSHGTALSIAGLKSFLMRGHGQDSGPSEKQNEEVEKVDQVGVCVQTSESVQVVLEDLSGQHKAADADTPGKIYSSVFSFKGLCGGIFYFRFLFKRAQLVL
jgi:hypothetical protein